jgi:hypothetical protein
MLNFRQFEVGPDPFGRKWQVLFKWLQTAISLRHSDTVDVKFVLQSDDTRVEKQIAMPHADLLELSRRTGHEMSDAWCSRLAAAAPEAHGGERRGSGEGPGDGASERTVRHTPREIAREEKRSGTGSVDPGAVR